MRLRGVECDSINRPNHLQNAKTDRLKRKLSVRRRKQLKSKLESGTRNFFSGSIKTRKTAENALKGLAAPTLGQGVCEGSKNPAEKGEIGESLRGGSKSKQAGRKSEQKTEIGR